MSNRRAILTSTALLLTLLAAPRTVDARVQPLALEHGAASQRIVLRTGMVGSNGGEYATSLPTSLMLHHIAVDAAGGDGADRAGARWSVVVYHRSAAGVTELAVLEPGRAVFQLPRTIGFLLNGGDSIGVRVRVDGGDTLQFSIGLDYEAAEGAQNRFGTLPVRADRAGDTATGTAWTWQAPATGRVLAFAGAALRGARELVLYDDAGTAIWRERLQPLPGEASRCPTGIVHLGVAVEAGRSYRLVVSPGAADPAEGVLHALLLPIGD